MAEWIGIKNKYEDCANHACMYVLLRGPLCEWLLSKDARENDALAKLQEEIVAANNAAAVNNVYNVEGLSKLFLLGNRTDEKGFEQDVVARNFANYLAINNIVDFGLYMQNRGRCECNLMIPEDLLIYQTVLEFEKPTNDLITAVSAMFADDVKSKKKEKCLLCAKIVIPVKNLKMYQPPEMIIFSFSKPRLTTLSMGILFEKEDFYNQFNAAETLYCFLGASLQVNAEHASSVFLEYPKRERLVFQDNTDISYEKVSPNQESFKPKQEVLIAMYLRSDLIKM